MGFDVRKDASAWLIIAAAAALGCRTSATSDPPASAASASASPAAAPSEVPPLPADLAATGLYSNAATRTVAADVRPFSPQYPLWTDGATKRRWIRLPPGSTIDASAPDAWQFPVGTKLWKEFAFGGRPVETRYIERTAAGWRFATYAWSEDGRTATLAPKSGLTASAEVADGVRHQIPGSTDCIVCHGNGATPVLGFSALQLSGDRDPNAPHREDIPPGALDLPALVAGGWLRGYTGGTSPRIQARSGAERAALGYLHANCGHCHRNDGALSSIGMVLASSSVSSDPAASAVLATTVDRPSKIAPERSRVARGHANESVLVDRMRSREPAMQMPPLGTQLVDDEGVRLVATWIEQLDD